MYEPPSSDVELIHQDNGNSVKAISIGVLIEIVGSTAMGVILGTLFTVYHLQHGATAEQIPGLLTGGVLSPYYLAVITLGTGISIIAGYICAKYSVKHIIRDVISMYVITIVIMSLLNLQSENIAETIVLSLISLAAVSFGAYLKSKRN
ncbi:MAG: hypothetical protein KUG78_14250 [Kangiellaceae bacterium]|nr:hypothetical protein [Kangiellaceae bacterium]